MYWKQSLLTLVGAATIFSTAQAQKAPTPSPDDQERGAALLIFIHNVDQRDIEMANLAKNNSTSKPVKDFADKVISDSKASDNQVQAYARSHNIDLNKAPAGTGGSGTSAASKSMTGSKLDDEIEQERRSRAVGSATGEYAFMAEPGHSREVARAQAEHRTALEKLRGLKGPEFDREFARTMVKEEQNTVDKVTAARSHISDPAIIVIVDEQLPTMKDDLRAAQALQNNLSNR
jgi:predicted outer membrane protein